MRDIYNLVENDDIQRLSTVAGIEFRVNFGRLAKRAAESP